MLTILQLKQYLGQKLAPKDNGRQEKDCISKEHKEISLETTSAVKERMERDVLLTCILLHSLSLYRFIKINLMETSKQQ